MDPALRKTLAVGALLVLGGGGTALLASSSERPADTTVPLEKAPPSGADDRSLDAEMNRLRSSTNGVERIAALRAAARIGTPESVRWLASLAEEDPAIGHHAATALRGIANVGAAGALLDLGTAPGSLSVRANAIRGLSRFASPDHVGRLSALLADATEPQRLRQEAALALGRAGGAEAERGLLQWLEEPRVEGDEALRLAVIEALSRFQSGGSKEALRSVSEESTTSGRERAFALRALEPRGEEGHQ